MSSPGTPIENRENTIEHPTGEHPPERNWKQCVQLRWVAFIQFLRRYTSRCKAKCQENERIARAVEYATANYVWIAAAGIIFAIGVYWLRGHGAFTEPTKIIVLLTFVL